MLSTNAQYSARAFLHIPRSSALVQAARMRDWAIDYILNVLEIKEWSANRLATEAGVAASTINRPLRDPEWPHKLSRSTIAKIRDASGVDPAPFIPTEMAEDAEIFSRGQRLLQQVGSVDAMGEAEGQSALNAQKRNEIKVAIVGPLAQIVATIDKDGIDRLRAKLDAIESMLDDE